MQSGIQKKPGSHSALSLCLRHVSAVVAVIRARLEADLHAETITAPTFF